MIPTRRGFLLGLGASIVTAPAIVRATSIMPVKVVEPAGIYSDGFLLHVPRGAIIKGYTLITVGTGGDR